MIDATLRFQWFDDVGFTFIDISIRKVLNGLNKQTMYVFVIGLLGVELIILLPYGKK